jgi:hypothetical protein
MSLDFYIYPGVHESGSESISFNITHNLAPMADKAGLYKPLWRPEENYDKPVLAIDVYPAIVAGFNNLMFNPENYKNLNPENGWGDYNSLVDFTANVLAALRQYPLAVVEACR